MSIFPVITATALGAGLAGYGLGRLVDVRARLHLRRKLVALEAELAELRSRAAGVQDRCRHLERYARNITGRHVRTIVVDYRVRR